MISILLHASLEIIFISIQFISNKFHSFQFNFDKFRLVKLFYAEQNMLYIPTTLSHPETLQPNFVNLLVFSSEFIQSQKSKHYQNNTYRKCRSTIIKHQPLSRVYFIKTRKQMAQFLRKEQNFKNKSKKTRINETTTKNSINLNREIGKSKKKI